MDNRETTPPSSDDPILKRHLFSGVTIKGRGDVGRVYFVRRPSRQSFGFRVAASSGPIPKAPGSAGGYLLDLEARVDTLRATAGHNSMTLREFTEKQLDGKRPDDQETYAWHRRTAAEKYTAG